MEFMEPWDIEFATAGSLINKHFDLTSKEWD